MRRWSACHGSPDDLHCILEVEPVNQGSRGIFDIQMVVEPDTPFLGVVADDLAGIDECCSRNGGMRGKFSAFGVEQQILPIT